MRTRAGSLPGLLLALALALSGCLAGTSDTFGPAQGGTVTGENDADNLLALAMRASPARGEAPLRVTFTVTAGGAEGPLPWTLDFGDGTPPRSGEGFPAEALHSYGKAGTYTAEFVVTGAGSASRSTLAIHVAPTHAVATPAPTSASSSASTTAPSSGGGGGGGGGGAPPTTSSSSSSTSATNSTTNATTSSASSTTASSNSTSESTTSASATTTSDPPTSTSTSTSDSSSTTPEGSSSSTTSDPPTSTSESTTSTSESSSTTTDPPA